MFHPPLTLVCPATNSPSLTQECWTHLGENVPLNTWSIAMCMFPLLTENSGAEYHEPARMPIAAAPTTTTTKTARIRRDERAGRSWQSVRPATRLPSETRQHSPSLRRPGHSHRPGTRSLSRRTDQCRAHLGTRYLSRSLLRPCRRRRARRLVGRNMTGGRPPTLVRPGTVRTWWVRTATATDDSCDVVAKLFDAVEIELALGTVFPTAVR